MLRVVVLLAAPLGLLVACPAGSSSETPSAAAGAAADGRSTPITITTQPPGATVIVDGAAVGESPVTLPLTPGPHRLRATMSGYYPVAETKIVVERGVQATHALALVASH